MTLQGMRIGVTAARKGRELATAFERSGALVAWGPTLATVPPERDLLLADETAAILADVGRRAGWRREARRRRARQADVGRQPVSQPESLLLAEPVPERAQLDQHRVQLGGQGGLGGCGVC